MERYQNQYNKEYMKLAMLKQEETFRQQVQELHRLYKVQRSLMTEAKNSQRVKKQAENETCSSKSSESNPYQVRITPDEQVKHRNFKLESNELDADLDLTLAIGSTQSKKIKKKEGSSLNTSDSGTSFSSSTSNETEGSRLNKSGTFLKSDLEMAFQKDGIQFESRFAMDGHHMNSRNEALAQSSPWMYQRFNLNFT